MTKELEKCEQSCFTRAAHECQRAPIIDMPVYQRIV